MMLKNQDNNITYIDGMPYAVCLPHGGTKEQAEHSEFAVLMRASNMVDMHCYMGSWCSNRFVGTLLNEEEGYYWDAAGIVTQYDGREENWGVTRANTCSYGLGFRPVLVPLDKDSLKPDFSRFGNLPDGFVVQMGSLYMGEKVLPNPVDPVASPMPKWDGRPEFGFYPGDVPKYDHGVSLRIGDTSRNDEEQIRFVAVGGKLVSDRVLLGCVSHDDLEREFHLSKDVTFRQVNKKNKETERKEDGPVSLWMRLGVSIDVTREELEALRDESGSGREMLIKLLCSGRCQINGDTYFPEDQRGLEDEIGFDLPNMAFVAQPAVKEKIVSNEKVSLLEQIQSVSARATETHSTDKSTAKESTPER